MPKEMEELVVKESRIDGKGLFTTKTYAKGAHVYTYIPEKILGGSEVGSLTPEEKHHLNRVGDDLYEIVAPPGCFMNHSCEPNIKEHERRGYALRDLVPGEEVTVDYDKDGYFEVPMRCLCGTANCKKLIRGKK